MVSTLVVNPGSSSRKFALYIDGQVVLELRFERVSEGFEVCSKKEGLNQTCESVSEQDFMSAFKRVSDEVTNYFTNNPATGSLQNIVVRIVAPGTFFQTHRVIDSDYIYELRKRESSAPLHVPSMLRDIQNAQHHFPNVRIVAASDSAFHRTLPPKAREYSLNRAEMEMFDIHRFGYHGLSVSSVVRNVHSLVGMYPEKVVVCHVGNGTSVTAVKNGQSVETTMGFSPSTGLSMGTRAGDLDNAALLEVMRKKNLSPAEAELYVNTNGGLLGLANESDIRILLERRSHGDELAAQALQTFAYHLQCAIAASTVALKGLDVLILTATAAERSSVLRSLITQDLAHLGVELSPERNELMVGKPGVISPRHTPVKVVVMRTDEMREMASVINEIDHTGV